ncbi:MAG: hypothetical protein Sylvanvirus23_7 [Sylvanvirus sp.]|uniref:Uncharacterized protein n=1 Tax=Sylvanvirus sp. TaxID=2487774 RepID=A0A3G5AIP4_9VIRU|nr:MAG: hypothetical protein Sylvanvirus23_7 [Sylvanvirus sp.]
MSAIGPIHTLSTISPISSSVSFDFTQWVLTHQLDYELWRNINRMYTYSIIGTAPISNLRGPENTLRLPGPIHERLSRAYQLQAYHFNRDGLFAAPSPVALGQFGLFTWIELPEDIEISDYGGRIWVEHELELYFANYPEILLKKQRYLWTLLSDGGRGPGGHIIENKDVESKIAYTLVADPTDCKGDLFNVRLTNNLTPLINEPPLDQLANCISDFRENVPVIPRLTKKTKTSSKQLSEEEQAYFDSNPVATVFIVTCRPIRPFSELLMLYEPEANIHNGQGTYDTRDYLVGQGCGTNTVNAIHNINNLSELKSQETKVLQQYQQSRERELQRFRDLALSSEFKSSGWIRPREQVDPQTRYITWIWPQLIVMTTTSSSPNVSSLSTSSVSSTSSTQAQAPYMILAATSIAKNMKLPILGLTMTEVEMTARLEEGGSQNAFLIQNRAGYLDGSPEYRPYNHCGGDGAFIWVWIRPASSYARANMEYSADGYFISKRKIEAYEQLTTFFD